MAKCKWCGVSPCRCEKCEQCNKKVDDCKCETCGDCGVLHKNCFCDKCEDCNKSIGDCECPSCENCGEHKSYCECKKCDICKDWEDNCECCLVCKKKGDECICCQYCGNTDQNKIEFCDNCTYCKNCCNNRNVCGAKQKLRSKKNMMSRVKQSIKSDAVNASYRIAAKNMVKIVKKPLINVLKKQGMNKPSLDMVGAFLETEMGGALVTYVVGAAISGIPMLSDNEKAARIAEECRIAGFETLGTNIVEFAIENLGPVFSEVVKAINSQPEITPGAKSKPLSLPTGSMAALFNEETTTKSKSTRA